MFDNGLKKLFPQIIIINFVWNCKKKDSLRSSQIQRNKICIELPKGSVKSISFRLLNKTFFISTTIFVLPFSAATNFSAPRSIRYSTSPTLIRYGS